MAHQNIRRDQTYDSAHKRGKTLVAKTKADCYSQNLQIDQDYSKFKDSVEDTERIRQEVLARFSSSIMPFANIVLSHNSESSARRLTHNNNNKLKC